MLSSSFTIGADPELICFKNGNFTLANNYFSSNNSFGLDGCEQTAEVWPGFSESPKELTSKIFQVLEYGYRKFPKLEFYYGHYVSDYAIGGHTHLNWTNA